MAMRRWLYTTSRDMVFIKLVYHRELSYNVLKPCRSTSTVHVEKNVRSDIIFTPRITERNRFTLKDFDSSASQSALLIMACIDVSCNLIRLCDKNEPTTLSLVYVDVLNRYDEVLYSVNAASLLL